MVMKKLLTSLIVILFLGCANYLRFDYKNAPVYPEDHEINDNPVFDLETVSQITIVISSNQWNELLLNYDDNPANEIYVHADFYYTNDGLTGCVTNVGFRVRGNMFSRARPEVHTTLHDADDPDYEFAHFRVKFNKYDRDTRFEGMRAINLKFFNGDPAYVREVYCMDLFERFGVWTAPRVAYTRLTIQIAEDAEPAYFGVYRINESIDREFLEDRFPDNFDGYLWKCLYPANLVSRTMYPEIGVEDPDSGDEPAYDLKTNEDELESFAKEQLFEFAQNLNDLEGEEFQEWIAQAMDVPIFLKALAVDVMVGMWDDYWGNQNNYYLYFDEYGKCYFIPYDYDNTLGTDNMRLSAEADPFNWGPMDKTRPLVYKILSVTEYSDLYAEYIQELISTNKDLLNPDASIARVVAWQEMIEPYLTNDTGEMEAIKDRGAYWSTSSRVRLTSGDTNGSSYNYFKLRVASAQIYLDQYFEYGYTTADEVAIFTDLDKYDDEDDEDVVTDSLAESFPNFEYAYLDVGYISPEFTSNTVIFRFTHDNPDAEIHILGTFNDWWDADDRYVLTNIATNLWGIELKKSKVWSGTRYKFFIDDVEMDWEDRWAWDPAHDEHEGNSYSSKLKY